MSEARPLPPRPALPASLWALAAAIVTLRAVLWWAPSAPALAAGAASALLALGGCALAARRWARMAPALPLVAMLACAVAASCLAGGVELARQAALARGLSESPVSSWELVVASDMAEGAHGWRGRAELRRGGVTQGSAWLASDVELGRGCALTCVGRFEADGEDEWGRTSRAQGLVGTVRVVRVLGERPPDGLLGLVLGLRERVLASLDPASSDARALLAGSVCGSSGALAGRGLKGLFATCGVSHLTAVSGGHLVLVSALARALLDRTRLRRVARALVLLTLTGGFVAFCGDPVSAVRSWAMSVVAAGAGLVGRRAHPLSSASVVALAMALVEPGVTGQLGYLLSVASVLAICAFGGYARHLVSAVAPRVPLPRRALAPLARAVRALGSGEREALAITLVSQLATLPLTCAAFGQLSLVAPLANVAVAPLFSVLLGTGLCAAALAGVPALQAPVLAVADAVGTAFVGVLRLLAALPLAAVAVEVDEGVACAVAAVLAAALWLWWPRPSRRMVVGLLGALAAVGVAWLLRWRLFAPACVRVLDVGQGDAILVTDGPAAVLVDTGPGEAVVAALARAHVYHLDAVVLTHLHEDHTGGLAELLSTVRVDEVVVAEGVDAGSAACGLPTVAVGLGDVLDVRGFSLRVVSPEGPVAGTENADSLELALSYDEGGRSLTGLLAGDAERDETAAALARGDVGDVDFLKVGHHGSAVSVDEGVAAALAPEVSVASAGEGNSYGHPTPECVETLEGAGSVFLCTKDVGDVCVSPGEEGPWVSCSRGGGVDVLAWEAE